MKKIKLLTLLPLIASSVSLSACNLDKNAKTFKFTNLTNEFYIRAKRMKLYFPDEGSLPYVDIGQFIEDLNGYLISDLISVYKNTSSNRLELSIPLLLMNSPVVTFDWKNDVITADQIFFMYITGQSQATDYMAHFKELEDTVIQTTPEKVKYNLKDYNFDIKYENGKVLLPFVLANMIFCSSNYYNLFFNGDEVIGAYGEVSDEITMMRITNCSLNGKDVPTDVGEATKNSLLFALDYYYGLKEDKGFTKALNFIDSNDLDELKSDYGDLHAISMKKIIYNQVNDLHSRIDFFGCYTSADFNIAYPVSCRGNRWTEFYDQRQTLTNLRTERFNNGVPAVRYSGDTAIISFDSFLTASTYQLQRPDAYKYDTYKFFQYVMKDIKTHSEVNDILIDLSLNGGGNIAAMINALGFITDDNIYYNLRDTLTKSNTRAAFIVDTDGDNRFDNDAYSQYRWSVLASGNTFSAANLFTSVFQSQGLGKVLGATSGGGMCAVLPLVLADGTAFTLSGNTTFRRYNNGEFESIEYGVDPDSSLTYDNFYNDEVLVTAVDNMYK